MKIKLFVLSLSMMLCLISCKKKVVEVATPKSAVETFKVGLDLVIKEDDSLQLYYKDEFMSDWVYNKCVTRVVKGSDVSQEVIFELPQDILPSELRIDIGTNRNQSEIEIKNFRMNYYDKSFVAKDTLFYQYFYPNDQIDYNREKAIAKPIVKKGVVFDPIFVSREVLTPEINKLIK